MKIVSFLRKNTILVVVLLLLLVCLLVCGYLTTLAELSRFKNQINKLEFSQQSYEETIAENGARIVEQEQLILSQKDAIALKVLEIDDLKKIKSQVVVNTITKVDSVFVPFTETDTIVVSITDTINNIDTIGTYLRVPTAFSVDTQWYGMNGTITTKGVNLDSLYFMNKQKVTIGSRSEGIFKKPKPIVLIENENPFVETTGMQNIVIQNELKWYEKKGLWFGVGVGVGVLVPVLIR